MFAFLNSPLQVLLETFLLTNLSINTILSINLFLLGSIWFLIYHCFNRFLYMYNMSHVTEQVQETYRNVSIGNLEIQCSVQTFYINEMDSFWGPIREFVFRKM